MSKKSFTDAKKPGRQPTPDEISAFEETGRAIARQRKITAKAERREHRKAESSIHGNTEIRDSGKESLRENEKPQRRNDGLAPLPEAVNTESSNAADTEKQKVEATVRLTVDLPESAHTRFKAACAITRRKMVEEVREMIERRTAELESRTGAPY